MSLPRSWVALFLFVYSLPHFRIISFSPKGKEAWKLTFSSSSVTEVKWKFCDRVAAANLASWLGRPLSIPQSWIKFSGCNCPSLWSRNSNHSPPPKLSITSMQLVKQPMTHNRTAANSRWAVPENRAKGSLCKGLSFRIIFLPQYLTSLLVSHPDIHWAHGRMSNLWPIHWHYRCLKLFTEVCLFK